MVDFLEFIEVRRNNNYQRSKILNLFVSLQEEKRLIQKFSDKIFKSLIIFPYLKIEKKGGLWVVSVLIRKEIYD